MDAAGITQNYLDEVSKAVMDDDWEAYKNCLSRPFLLISHTSTMSFSDPDEIRSIYLDFQGLLRSQRVTDYIRLVASAEQFDPDLISARYVTHLLSGGRRVMDPIRSSISLRLEGNRWRAASITNDVSNSRWPMLLPRLGEETP